MKSFIRLLIPVAAVIALGGLFAGAAGADNNQTASNLASSIQSVAAISGGASADGANSTATSGAASAAAILSQTQAIFQSLDTSDCECDNAQLGANQVASEQGVASASGLAAAIAGGVSLTGDAASIADLIQDQLIEQMGIN